MSTPPQLVQVSTLLAFRLPHEAHACCPYRKAGLAQALSRSLAADVAGAHLAGEFCFRRPLRTTAYCIPTPTAAPVPRAKRGGAPTIDDLFGRYRAPGAADGYAALVA
jgi:hypothetical protein